MATVSQMWVRYKRPFHWIMAGLGVLLVLLFIALLLAPKLINLESFREKAIAGFHEKTGGRIDYQRVDLSFFPRPCAIIHQAEMSLPDKGQGRIESISVYPRILSLLKGRVRVAEVFVDAPDLTIPLPARPEKGVVSGPKEPTQGLEGILGAMTAPLSLEAPDLIFAIERGSLTLLQQGKPAFSFGRLKARFVLPPTGFKVVLNCTSNLWEEMRLESTLDPEPSQGVRARLEAREVDVSSVREAALGVAGHIQDVREIFDVVRGGTVPAITCRAQGSSLSALGDLQNLIIGGSLVDGRISLAEPGLALVEVQGDAVISGGTLEGENLEARFGNSWGRQGRLKLGLEGDDAPFHLDILVDADLAQLPPFLRKVTGDNDLVRELDLLQELKGRGVGMLMLGESTGAINATVDVSELECSAQHKKVPYPITIKGRKFLYDETAITVEKLGGTVGKSAFSQLSVRVDWKGEPHFEVRSGLCQIVLHEIFPWVTSFDGLSGIRENYNVPQGILEISEMAGKGLLLEPPSWQFRTGGSFKDVVLDMSSLPGALKISGGRFTAVDDRAQQTATFDGLEIRLLDASLKASGVLNDYLTRRLSGDITFTGDFDAHATAWLSELARIPDVLDFRTPLSFSEGHFVWGKGGEISFKGEATVGNGPQISTEMHRSPRVLIIDEVTIRDQDQESHMALSFDYDERDLSLGFRGHMTRETLNRLFVTNRFTNGWIKGDFKARVLLKDPAESSAEGTLSGDDIVFPLSLEFPMVIDAVDLNADGQHLRIDSAVFSWEDERVALNGDVLLSPEGYELNMELATIHLDLDKVLETLGKSSMGTDQEERAVFYDFPIRGTVKLKSDRCTYKSFSVAPLHGEVSFRQDKIGVIVTEAQWCGLSSSGVLEVSPGQQAFEFSLSAENQEVAQTVNCLLSERLNATGKYTLKGTMTGQGKGEGLVRALQGNIELLAENGWIYRHVPMQRLLAYLNVTDLFRGRIPDMSKEGFPYQSIEAEARIENGKLIMDEWILESPSMEIIGQGQLDLERNSIDMTILVAPLKAVDSVVRRIPGVNYITGGTLVSVAAKIQGNPKNPQVKALPASAVGEGLLGMMKRALKLPIKVIEPLGSRGEAQEISPQAGP